MQRFFLGCTGPYFGPTNTNHAKNYQKTTFGVLFSLPPQNALQCTTVQCSYILFSVRFRTDSSSVRKKIFNISIKFSEPNPVRFGRKNSNISASKLSQPSPVRFGIFSHNCKFCFTEFKHYLHILLFVAIVTSYLLSFFWTTQTK